MGEYLKIEQGSMLLRLVDVSEEDSSSAEKSKMADITWFTGKGFFEYNYILKSGPSVYISGMVEWPVAGVLVGATGHATTLAHQRCKQMFPTSNFPNLLEKQFPQMSSKKWPQYYFMLVHICGSYLSKPTDQSIKIRAGI